VTTTEGSAVRAGRPPYRLIATAGHVDHGKSTLVRALTGIDPDRLAEEKERGLTIDLGFAHLELPSGGLLGLVDVPGHARYLKNMVAGVGSVGGCLFVVSAREGWRAQSEEHLNVLELLGVRAAVVALSQADRASSEQLGSARAQIEDRFAESSVFLQGLVETDATTGVGLEPLVSLLDQLAESLPDPPDTGRPRLFIDRAFSLRGIGTVVTGTLTGGEIALGERLEVHRRNRPPASVRVRHLQVHGHDRQSVYPGERVAANLSGLSAAELQRGDCLVRGGDFECSDTFDAEVVLLPGARLKTRCKRQLHIGTAHFAASLRLLGIEELSAGAAGAVRFRLPAELPLSRGDLFLLRDGGQATTIGGGEILDVRPVLPAKRARPDRSYERVVAEHGFIDAGLLERLTGVSSEPDSGRFVFAPSWRQSRQDELLGRLRAEGRSGLAATELEDHDRALLDVTPEVNLSGGRYRLEDLEPLTDHPYLRLSQKTPLSPPSTADFSRPELRELVRAGSLVECEGLFFIPEAIVSAEDAFAELAAGSPSGVTVSQFRQALGISRRIALVLLTYFDETGRTRRDGDLRTAGPVLARREEAGAFTP
jgi:selenocysteine-specific elongation factor